MDPFEILNPVISEPVSVKLPAYQKICEAPEIPTGWTLELFGLTINLQMILTIAISVFISVLIAQLLK